MIDLSYRPEKKEEEKELGMGGLILCLLPFAVLLWVVVTASICGGKFW